MQWTGQKNIRRMFVFICVCLCWCALHSFFLFFISSWYFIIAIVVAALAFPPSLFVITHRLSWSNLLYARERLITQWKVLWNIEHENHGKRTKRKREREKNWDKKRHQRQNKLTSAAEIEHRFAFRILKFFVFFATFFFFISAVPNGEKKLRSLFALFPCFYSPT